MRVWREFPSGPTRRVPEERPRHRALRPDAAAAVLLDRDARRSAIRTAASTASRSPIRWSRRRSCGCSAPTASWSSTRCCCALAAFCGYLFLRGAHAAGRRGAARRRVRDGVGGAGLLRVDCAGALQLHARSAGVFLLALQGSAPRRSRRAGARRDGCSGRAATSSPRVLLGIATFSKVSNALLFPPIVLWLLWRRRWRAGGRRRRSLFARRRGRAVRGQHGDLRRVELSGRRGSPHVRLRVPVPDAATPGSTSARRRSANEALDRHHLQPARVLDEPDPQPRATCSSAATPGWCRISFRPRSRCWRSSPAPRRRPLWQWLVLGGGAGAAALLRASSRRTPGSAAAARSAIATSWAPTGRSCSCCRRSRAIGVALVPWMVGGLFVAPLVLNPFVTSFYPGTYAAHGRSGCCRSS